VWRFIGSVYRGISEAQFMSHQTQAESIDICHAKTKKIRLPVEVKNKNVDANRTWRILSFFLSTLLSPHCTSILTPICGLFIPRTKVYISLYININYLRRHTSDFKKAFISYVRFWWCLWKLYNLADVLLLCVTIYVCVYTWVCSSRRPHVREMRKKYANIRYTL